MKPFQSINNHIIIILTFFFIAKSSQQIYSNQQAFDCFQKQALQVCAQSFSSCFQNPYCIKQLEQFNQCSFDDSEEERKRIFNGNCFKQWHDKAIHTAGVITCLSKTCNLLYNSHISFKQLYKCLQLFLLEKQVECGDECQKVLQNTIGIHIYNRPLEQLYTQTIEHPQADTVAKLIYSQCILQSGSGRKMLAQQMKLKDEYKRNAKNDVQVNDQIQNIDL